MELHKAALYANICEFNKYSHLISNHVDTLYHCISKNSFNFEFLQHISQLNIDDLLPDNSIYFSGLIQHGFYKTPFSFPCLVYYNKENIFKLIKYKDLHLVLAFISITHKWKDLFDRLDTNTSYDIDTFFNVPEKVSSSYFYYTQYQHFDNIDFNPKFFDTNNPNLYKDYDFYYLDHDDIFSFSKISNLDRYFLDNYLVNNEIIYKHDNINDFDILSNTSVAVYSFTLNKYINHCVSRFIFVSPYLSLNLYKSLNIFFIPSFYIIREDIAIKYIEINPLIRFNFMYSKIKYHIYTSDFVYNEDFVEYNLLFIACKSYNKLCYNIFLNKIQNGSKIFKIMDLENECYLPEPLEMKFDLDLDFDINLFKLSKF